MQVRSYAQAVVFIAQPIAIISLAFVNNAQGIVFVARAMKFVAQAYGFNA